jgi:hypothetical protein
MSAPVFGISVQNTTPQPPTTSAAATTRRMAILGTAGSGPAGWTKITPAQAARFGNANASLGYSLPLCLAEAFSQSPENKAYDVEYLVARTHTTSATANLVDGSAYPVVALTAQGTMSGSAGNALSVASTGPQVMVNRIQIGNGAHNEIHQIAIYAASGASGTFTLTGKDYQGVSFTTAAITYSATAATMSTNIQTALNTASPGGYGSAAVAVAVATVPPTAIAGAVYFNVTFSGTNYKNATWAPANMGTDSLTGGTGVVPLQSIVVSQSGAPVQTITFGPSCDLSTVDGIINAFTAANPTGSASAVLVPTNVAADPSYFPAAQLATSFAGGSDGLGGTVANDSGGTIAALLADLASNNYGEVHLVACGFDANSITALATAAAAAGEGNNVHLKFVLGPSSSVPKATLTSSYQIANTGRVTIIGVSKMPGSCVNGTLPGYAIAAGVANMAAMTSAEFNLWNRPVSGVVATWPVDSATNAKYTPGDIDAIANAHMTPLRYDRVQNALVVDRFLTTAPSLDSYGSPNPFIYFSVQDCYDMLARQLYETLYPVIGDPDAALADVTAQIDGLCQAVFASTYKRYHNGAYESSTFDPTTNPPSVTIYATFGPRLPIGKMVIYLAAQPGYSS